MEADFWHERWQTNEIGFHEGAPNALLVTHFESLMLPAGGRVFVPLCGKSRDMHWLLDQGYRVAGAELSPLAVGQFFEELGLVPEIEDLGTMTHYRSEGVEIFVGDIFQLSKEVLGAVDAIYDRAALVALPTAMRTAYGAHLVSICNHAPQLLLTLEYEYGLITGPPFSIEGDHVRALYGGAYEIIALDSRHASTGLKGKYPYTERAWHLK